MRYLRGALLLAPAMVAYIPPLLTYPLSSMLGVLAGVGAWVAGRKVWEGKQLLEVFTASWFALGLAAALVNSSQLAAASVGFLISSFLVFSAFESVEGLWAAAALTLPYLAGISAAECLLRGIPVSKLLPFMWAPAQGEWLPPDLSVRVVFGAVAGYFLAEYVLRNIRFSRTSYAVIAASLIYTFVSIAAVGLTPYELSPYIAVFAALAPIGLWVLALKVGGL
ncbi:MAG: hypothetical protein J7L55_00765 [Desulfurococcales archaeon]|nr:hypothetical protein [Desulfurococcales archaeon]